MTGLGEVVQRHEKHLFDIDRETPPPPGNNRCQIDAAAHGVPSAGERTNPWRPPCNVTPRFVMVSLDGDASGEVTYTVEVEGREIASATVPEGTRFARVELDDAFGFGVAETMQVVADTPGGGYTSATVSTVLDAPSQWFLSGTLIFPSAPAEGDLFSHFAPGGGD